MNQFKPVQQCRQVVKPYCPNLYCVVLLFFGHNRTKEGVIILQKAGSAEIRYVQHRIYITLIMIYIWFLWALKSNLLQ
jgi:hypothetical protein